MNRKALSKKSGKIGGQRPRPRVALVGNFGADDVAHFLHMFPTVWRANEIWRLCKLVDVREIDLIVLASGVDEAGDWPSKAHVICFSKDISRLPGPVSNSYIKISGVAETEEFLFPDIPLPLSRRREADYSNLTSIRGWKRLRLGFLLRSLAPTQAEQKAATIIFNDGAIICEHHTKLPLAVAFLRNNNNLGVGWFPNVAANRAAWVELLVTQWAQSDKDAFSDSRDWTGSPEWMVVEEEKICSQILALERKKQQSMDKIEQQIGELTTKLALAKADANKGQRRLITAQGEELEDEVAKTLENIGFDVTRVDKLLSEKEPKREDLRLKHLDKRGEEWNAIIEVRGYGRSGGKTADLQRLHRFAGLYQKETGHDPDKRIYIINGELELLPSQRQEPLAPAIEDLQTFSESDGILIWSIDLFRALKTTDPLDYPALLDSIKYVQGRWSPPP